MFATSASIAPGLIALAGWALLTAARGRGRISRRAHAALLAALVAVALVAHMDLLGRTESGGLLIRLPSPHDHEFFHYGLGTRYFAELGYTGLYDATVVADSEDDPAHFRPDAIVRDLSTYLPVSRGSVLEHAAQVKAPFTPERWRAFKADLAQLRANYDPEYWHESGYTSDHGYNATPLVTAVLSGFGRGFDAGTLLGTVPFLDPYLIGLLAVAVLGIEGTAAGLTLLFFLWVNPLNDFAFVGGGFLRSDYLVSLGLGLLLLRARRFAASGACLAVSGWLRIFPLAVPAALLARDLASPDRRRLLRERRGLHVSFAVTSLLILAATSAVDTPDGGNPWVAFAHNIALHAESPSANRIGLTVPFGYSPEKDVHYEGHSYGWAPETEALQRERLPFRLPIAAVLLAVSLLALRRGRDADAFLAALLWVFAMVPLSHYYYAVLGLLPLVTSSSGRRLQVLAAGFAVLLLTSWPGWLERSLDLRFALLSCEVGLLLLACLWVGRWEAKPQPAGVASQPVL